MRLPIREGEEEILRKALWGEGEEQSALLGTHAFVADYGKTKKLQLYNHSELRIQSEKEIHTA